MGLGLLFIINKSCKPHDKSVLSRIKFQTLSGGIFMNPKGKMTEHTSDSKGPFIIDEKIILGAVMIQ